jgi:hypothetical protein
LSRTLINNLEENDLAAIRAERHATLLAGQRGRR